MEQTPLIQMQGLRFAYGPVSVLADLGLTLGHGERIAIMGRSGAGKSTLLHILALLQSFNEGRFLFDGEAVDTLERGRKEEVRARHIGMVFQAHYLIPYLTVEENVVLACELAGVPADPNQVTHLLACVGLTERGKHRPTQLSGGEQQRAGLVRALAKQPLLLLADEPTGNLDVETGGRVLDLMLDPAIYAGAVIAVTHQPEVANRFDRVLALRDGRLQYQTWEQPR
ncbi:ABC transporter ATP-binding protein [Acanthopleuribacter pedis]|uniref:ABC transporter ATP-binding protein n=1 Tax=Acanthopleuribacter pedis TaxID=442870 RepID=A0A8J7U528_9BACT|nr:ABC transporter ATP-binding protein [Acanthopleuribacter pedis]MBO1321272.1 ABC transporter ATP-binding protein [Acanthopleuribacter pedis]